MVSKRRIQEKPYIHIHIDIEDLTLNSLHTTLVFQAEDKGVACPPLSSGMTEVCSVAVPEDRRHLCPPHYL